MTPHQIVAVALRLFAVWLGFQALRTLPALFALGESASPGYAYALFMLVLTAAVVLALWFFPRTITGKLLPPNEAQPQPAATADTWLAMGCALIGLLILTPTIPRLVFDVFALNYLSSYEDRSTLLRGVLYDLIELVISIWLILGGKGFRKIFWWARNAGTRKAL